jgi:single-stranded DNA-specific DHH superfamily exonuclease
VPSTKRGCKGQTETRVEQACRNCTNIKNRQTKARDSSLDTIKQTIEEKDLLKNKVLIIPLEEAVEKNLTGLIANQLMSEYQRPVLLLNKCSEDWQGSGRGCGQSKFNDFREFLANSGLVEYSEGHNQAFGCGVAQNRVAQLIDYCNEKLKDFDFSPSYKVDFIWASNNLNAQTILNIAGMNQLWGQGMEEALVAVENIKIYGENIKLLAEDRNPTLKITLPNGISLLKFRSSKEEYNSLHSDLGCVTINIVGKCERNIWNGIVSPQIMIEELEVVGKTEYYF